MDEEPLLRAQPFAPARGLPGRTRRGWGEVGRKDQGEGVVEAMSDPQGRRQPARWAEDGEIEFVRVELGEKRTAGLMDHAQFDVGAALALCGEEARQVGKADGLRDADADFLRRIREPLAQPDEHGVDVANEPRAFLQQESSRIGDDHAARGAYEERDGEPCFHTLNLPRDGALRQPRLTSSAGEGAMPGDELKEMQLVEVKRNGGEILMHNSHQTMQLMNFTQQPESGIVAAIQQTPMADRTQKTPNNVPGPFYVDETCIDCDLCRETAPATFRRDDESGGSYVWRQPTTTEERTLAEDALQCCPTETIGNDGDA